MLLAVPEQPTEGMGESTLGQSGAYSMYKYNIQPD
jgi:hypothetical protein